jgi:hypothetical protein
LRYASGLAFALFLFSFLANFLSLPAAQQTLSAAQAPADTARVGLAPPAAAATPAPTQSGPFLGGGAPEATGTVLPQLGAALAPTETPAGTPGLGMIAPAPTQAPAANATVTKSAAPPRFPGWEAGMLALALLLALGAFVIRWRTERDFARKAGKG